MAKRTYPVTAGDVTCQLRLTLGGQRALRQQFDEEPLQTVLEAAVDGERMAAVLQQALNWEGNRNPVTSGEELYDRLVDCGWAGQADFGELAFQIAAESGLISREQAKQLQASVLRTVDAAFDALEEGPQELGPFPQG